MLSTLWLSSPMTMACSLPNNLNIRTVTAATSRKSSMHGTDNQVHTVLNWKLLLLLLAPCLLPLGCLCLMLIIAGSKHAANAITLRCFGYRLLAATDNSATSFNMLIDLEDLEAVPTTAVVVELTGEVQATTRI